MHPRLDKRHFWQMANSIVLPIVSELFVQETGMIIGINKYIDIFKRVLGTYPCLINATFPGEVQ